MFYIHEKKKGVGIAIVHPYYIIKFRLPNECIYSAEAITILKTIGFIKKTTENLYKQHNTDSLSTLTSFDNATNPSDIAKLKQEETSEIMELTSPSFRYWVTMI